MARSLWPALARAPHTLGFVHAGTIRTRWLAAGSPDAPAVVFLHGFGSHIETFAHNLEAHAESRRFVAIDMLGHGYTDAPDRPYEISDYIVHVSDLFDALGLGRVDLFGAALGAWVAARFAVQHPEQVRKLTLSAPAGLTADPKAMEFVRRISMEAVEKPTLETVRARLEAVMSTPRSVTDDLLETRLELYERPGSKEAMRNVLCLQEMDCRQRNLLSAEELERIQAPTLVVSGELDTTTTPEIGARFAGAIPDARQTVFEGGGHWVHYEQPEDFNAAHLGFLDA